MIYLIVVLAALFVVLLSAMLFGRWFLMAVFHFGGCLLCISWMLRIYNSGSPVSQTLGFVLYALATLPFGWAIPVFHPSDGNSIGILLLNSFAWAGAVEWMLRRFVDPPAGFRAG